MKFCLEFINEFKSIVIEFGFFPAVLMFIVMIPVFLFSLIFLPFEIFNEWSRSWFKEK